MPEIKVRVRKSHIEQGTANRSGGGEREQGCAIALALKDAGLEDVFVAQVNVSFRLGGSKRRYADFPERARRFIRGFDAKVKGKPFSFSLELPA